MNFDETGKRAEELFQNLTNIIQLTFIMLRTSKQPYGH